MTDSIEDSDVRRVDQNVDPTALNSQEIEESMPDDFSKEAKQAFSKRVSEARAPVRNDAQRQIIDATGEPGANGKRMLYGKDIETGRTTSVGTAANVEQGIREDGTVIARNTNTGTTAEIGTVDLDKGAEGRADNW